jgi:DNA-binding beta-propeller fold protein YncE
VSARLRQILPVLLATLLAAIIGQAPVASASAGRVLHPARSHPPAPAASRPSLAWQRHIGAAFSLHPWRSGPVPSAGPFTRSSGFGSALVGSAPVGNGLSAVALDAATHTIYVANGSNPSGPNAGGNTVSVIDARHCNAQDVSHCKGPWPTIKVGDLPSSITVDQATDTVYVTIDGSNTVAVFNGATCNGRVTWGCHQPPAHVRVGPGPYGIFANDANHTVYVANPGGTTVSMINTLTCNGSEPGAMVVPGYPAAQFRLTYPAVR